MNRRNHVSLILILLLPFGCFGEGKSAGKEYQLFSRTNLVAWCIVPFDAKKRGPEERAVMLERMGIRHLAYDYRAEHIPTFDAEMDALKKHRIALTAWWFPTTLNAEARQILDVLKRHKLKTQLWVMGDGAPTKSAEEQKARVDAETSRIRPIAEEAAKLGCKVGLYNHGGWFGEPENQIAIIQQLDLPNVGIVYNLHHGHEHLARFPELLQKMKPYLLALNLNGMEKEGERLGEKIMPIGQGSLDLELLKTIVASGWQGPVGILNHTEEDAEARLLDNLEGLEWLVAKLQGYPAGAQPRPRSWTRPKSSGPQAQNSTAENWVESMKKVHQKFTGKTGTLAQFGDSITITMAYWAPLAYQPKNLSPEAASALSSVKKHLLPECWDKWKGASYGNEGSMTIRWALQNVDAWLKTRNPETALIMFGSNDVGQMDAEEYTAKTRELVRRCLTNGTVVILSTPPPRHGQVEKSKQFAEAIRKISLEDGVPLIDYQAEILKRRPEDWDGALPKFKDSRGDEYQVPTLIAKDGVHPSNFKPHENDFSEEGLRTNGFALRNYLSLLAYAEVVRNVLGGT